MSAFPAWLEFDDPVLCAKRSRDTSVSLSARLWACILRLFRGVVFVLVSLCKTSCFGQAGFFDDVLSYISCLLLMRTSLTENESADELRN